MIEQKAKHYEFFAKLKALCTEYEAEIIPAPEGKTEGQSDGQPTVSSFPPGVAFRFGRKADAGYIYSYGSKGEVEEVDAEGNKVQIRGNG